MAQPTASVRSGIHVPELDGVRGIAICLVLLIHFWPNTGYLATFTPVAEAGWIGVDLFFVLSGYLITGILLDSLHTSGYYRSFYTRRLFRIFPLYYVFLAGAITAMALWRQGMYYEKVMSEWGSPAWLFLCVGNFISTGTGTFIPVAALSPTWSLNIEEQYYSGFPFAVRKFGPKVWIFLSALFAVSLAWRCIMYSICPDNTMIQYLGTLSKADCLAAGGLAACAMRRPEAHKWKSLMRWTAPSLLTAVAVMYVFTGSSANHWFIRTLGYSLNAGAFASVIFWIVQRPGTPAVWILRLTPLRFLGKISYSLYLLHLPVQSALKIALRIPLGSDRRTPMDAVVWFSAALFVAWISWKFFERPVLEWGTRWTRVKG